MCATMHRRIGIDHRSERCTPAHCCALASSAARGWPPRLPSSDTGPRVPLDRRQGRGALRRQRPAAVRRQRALGAQRPGCGDRPRRGPQERRAAGCSRRRPSSSRASSAQHDQFLLTTYVSAKEIEQLRDERLDQIDGQIKASSSYIDSLALAAGRARGARHALQALQQRPERAAHARRSGRGPGAHRQRGAQPAQPRSRPSARSRSTCARSSTPIIERYRELTRTRPPDERHSRAAALSAGRCARSRRRRARWR